MAIRVHVAAALSLEKEEFEREVSSPLELRVETCGPWIFASTSVWDVAGEDLDRGLSRLSCPTLRATTVDGALWELRLRAPGSEPAALTHQFNLLHPEMADELKGYEQLQELAEDGWINPEQVADLAGLSPAEAMQTVARQSNDAIIHAVTELGLPGDALLLRGVLDGTSVTPQELEWDVGNLPRFLAALGLEGPFDDWREQIEDQRQHEEQRQRAAAERPAEDLLGPLELALEGMEPEALEGSPVVARLEHLVLVPWACNKDLTAGVRVTMCDGNPTPEVDRGENDELEIVRTGDSLRIGYFGRGSRDDALKFCAAVQPLLESLPDGTRVELLCAEPADDPDEDLLQEQLADLPPELRDQLMDGMDLDDEVNTAGNQIYAGRITGGQWQVTAACPAVPSRHLRQACELFAAACRGEALEISEEEGADLQDAAGTDLFLEGCHLEFGEGTVMAEDCPRHLAALIFRHRFREVWDVEQAEAAELKLWQELDDDVFGCDFDDDPGLGEVLLEGSWSTFHHGTMEGWQGLTPEDVAAMDAEMKGLDLEPLGDLVALAAGSIVLRGYGAAGATLYGTWMVGAFDTRVVELFSTFQEAGSLTTTSNPVAICDEAAAVFKQSFPGQEPQQLFQHHQQRLEELMGQGHVVVEAEPDLAALARSIDEFMA